MTTSTAPLTSALKAIVARIDGRFDDTNLIAFGPLQTSVESDCREIAQAALLASPASSEELVECTGHSSKLDAAERQLVAMGYSWEAGEWMGPIESTPVAESDQEPEGQWGEQFALQEILTEEQANDPRVRRRYFLRDNLYFAPLAFALSLYACAAWLLFHPALDGGVDVAVICIFVGTMFVIGSVCLAAAASSLVLLDVHRLGYLEQVARSNAAVAMWLHTAFSDGKQIRFKDYLTALRHDKKVEKLRQAAREQQAHQTAVGSLARICSKRSTTQ
ncbi:hypothetical protein [Stenotrophomonas geniculata]|uniref:hypothetical protein n=1 Tax=Stenotrophomonas geniculata TaxID=86188 RepID=UPI002E78B0C6|nr:hypothetical protein [Stenotrophomonas geniculata]